MRLSVFAILFLSLFASCNENEEIVTEEIIIKGNVSGVPDGKIYFVESRKWKTPLDSTNVVNGHFKFTTKIQSSFSPFLAAIHYWDGSKVIRLIYRNHTLGKDSLKYSTDAFYAEPGTIIIEGDNKTAPFLRIFAGKENELLFKNQFVDFGWIANLDADKRTSTIESFKKTIRQNPNSFFLLESIFRSKEQYSKSELDDIFLLFSKAVRQSKEGVAYQNYLSIRPDDNAPFPNLALLTPDNKIKNIFDANTKIQMLVFWASWCAPCRKEIPLLKEIEKKYSGTGLKIISISIDEKKEHWLKAVSNEKMNWPQVHVPLEQINDVQNQFRFTTIPLIIFTDSKGKEIKRFADYDPDNVGAYEALIDTYLR